MTIRTAFYFDVSDQQCDRCKFYLWNIEEIGPCNEKGACNVWNGKTQNNVGVVTPNNINITQPQI